MEFGWFDCDYPYEIYWKKHNISTKYFYVYFTDWFIYDFFQFVLMLHIIDFQTENSNNLTHDGILTHGTTDSEWLLCYRAVFLLNNTLYKKSCNFILFFVGRYIYIFYSCGNCMNNYWNKKLYNYGAGYFLGTYCYLGRYFYSK